MLRRIIARGDAVSEAPTKSNAGIEFEYRGAVYEYEHEHEYEHEYEHDQAGKPDPSLAPMDGLQGFSNEKSTVHPG